VLTTESSPCEMRVCLASRLDLLGKWRMTVPDFLRWWPDFKFGEDRVSASRSFLLRAETLVDRNCIPRSLVLKLVV
jgi:hypothetical protein